MRHGKGSAGRSRDPETRAASESVADIIVAQATRLFAQKGYSSTTIDDVVAAAHLTKGAFYYHFRAKDDLLYEIYHQVIAAELDGLMRILQAGKPPLETLIELIEDVCRVTARYPDNVIVYIREMHLLSDARSRALRDNRRRYHEGFKSLIERARDDGQVAADTDAELATIGFFGLLHQYYFWYRGAHRPFDDEQFVASATHWFLQGLGVDATAAVAGQ